jgi:CBS domain-containing protein
MAANFLHKQNLSALISSDFKLITIDSHETIENALTTLTKFNISAAPVFNEERRALGYVDTLDILAFLAYALGLEGKAQLPPGPLLESLKQLMQRPVKEIINLSGLAKWVTVPRDAHLIEVGELMAQPHVHRVAITDFEDTSVCYGVVTQSRYIQFLSEHPRQFERHLQRKVWQAFHNLPVEKIQSDKLLIEALTFLHESKLSGLAVVDRNDKLIGNISASDIKRSVANSLDHLLVSLFDNVESFLRSTPSGVIENTAQHVWKPIYVTRDDYVRTAVELLSTHKQNTGEHIHRIYVADEQLRPVRVISLSDMIGYLIEWPISVQSH